MKPEFDIVFYGLAVGFIFVWLFGFAVGYQDPISPWVIFSLSVASLVAGKKISDLGR